MNILLVEDDERISKFLVKGLGEAGYQMVLADSGEKARDLISTYDFDIILMDIMLPGLDGMQLTQIIRFKKNYTPILVLSALNSPDDKIKMLDLGADDYLSKPFHFEELISRIKALTRRNKLSYQEGSQLLRCGNLTIDTDLHKVVQDNKEIELSPTEYKLLTFLLENKNKVLSRTQILHNVWGIDFDSTTNVVDVYISYVRNKIDETDQKIIHTIKGTGYLIKD
ncbi:response regulator transcription factor [Chryseobacterium sp. PTM-20240506]|uniref:response regulator transcription factor n=1 Tax=unclassified Chryseobacterium TaxID=2593645 RepID=UPI0015573690|nr:MULTISPECIES: response regulator transcription factor [unclassified Chryseobacterium]MDC8106398.1 response regulator transcription factor [Chryseobacterium sp. B21-037]MDQ1804901.1 response regulator transcription factor [Chryseobacterium sp. CKR4-1]